MKKIQILVLGAIVAGCVGCTHTDDTVAPASAGTAVPTSADVPPVVATKKEAKLLHIYAHVDTNHDGVLTAAELGEEWESLKVADVDGSNSVSLDELVKGQRPGGV